MADHICSGTCSSPQPAQTANGPWAFAHCTRGRQPSACDELEATACLNQAAHREIHNCAPSRACMQQALRKRQVMICRVCTNPLPEAIIPEKSPRIHSKHGRNRFCRCLPTPRCSIPVCRRAKLCGLARPNQPRHGATTMRTRGPEVKWRGTTRALLPRTSALQPARLSTAATLWRKGACHF